jgi:hypothetical protein
MKRTAVLIFGAVVLFIWLASGCGPSSSPAPTATPSPTATLPPGQEPVAVVSVTGPWEPINPGGPTIEITLKNVSDEPVIFLEASLDLDISSPGNPYIFHFEVSVSNPLPPGGSISSRQTLIGGGFADNIAYSLTINGALQSNVAFAYTKEVLITPTG